MKDVEILRDARRKAGLTQEELAFRADISDRYMRKIEGGSPPSRKVLRSILAVLNEHDVDISVDDVLASWHEKISKPAQDKALLTRWFQRVWNEHDLSAMDEMMHEDCILTAEGAVAQGREEIRTRVAANSEPSTPLTSGIVRWWPTASGWSLTGSSRNGTSANSWASRREETP